MSAAYKCDRCASFFTTLEGGWLRVEVLKPFGPSTRRWVELDLCPECQKKLEDFVGIEKDGEE